MAKHKKDKSKGSFWEGTPGHTKTYPKFTKGQQKAFDEFLNFARQELKGGNIPTPPNLTAPNLPIPTPLPHAPAYQAQAPEAQPLNFNVEPLLDQARASYQQNTLPSLAERFSSLGMGAQGSSGFRNQLAASGQDLERQLAEIQSRYGYQTAQQNEANRLQAGQFGEQSRLAGAGLNAGSQFRTGVYNQQTPLQVGQYNIGNQLQTGQQNISNLLGARQSQLGIAGQFAGLGGQNQFERAYFQGQPGFKQQLLGGLGQFSGPGLWALASMF